MYDQEAEIKDVFPIFENIRQRYRNTFRWLAQGADASEAKTIRAAYEDRPPQSDEFSDRNLPADQGWTKP